MLPLFFPSLINVFLPPLGSLVQGRKFAHSRQGKRKIVLLPALLPQLQMIIDQHTLLNPAPQKDQQRLCCLAFFFLLFLGGRFSSSSSSFFSRQMGPSHARGKGDRRKGGKLYWAFIFIEFPPHIKIINKNIPVIRCLQST